MIMSEQETLSPKEIADVLGQIAEKKGAANIREQLFLAILAGVYIGFGAVVATMVASLLAVRLQPATALRGNR